MSWILNFLVLVIVTGFKKENRCETTRLGSNYGGYYVPTTILETQKEKTLISCGLGFDISFDIAMIEYGFQVLGVEPINESIEYVQFEIQSHNLESKYILIPKAVSSISGFQEFKPLLYSHNYHWWANQGDSGLALEKIVLPSISLEDILHRITESSQITVAKFDIEGAEIDVIESILENGFRFDWLILELDYLNLIKTSDIAKKIKRSLKVRRMMRALESQGYTFRFNEEFNFFWDGPNSI
jgi:FkbM family methyltransferase